MSTTRGLSLNEKEPIGRLLTTLPFGFGLLELQEGTCTDLRSHGGRGRLSIARRDPCQEEEKERKKRRKQRPPHPRPFLFAGHIALLNYNQIANDMVGETDMQATLQRDTALLYSALAKGGEEVRVDVVGVGEKPFLVRIFAVSDRHLAIHMHNPEHPLVMITPQAGSEQSDPTRPPLLSVHVAAELVSSYAAPGRKKARHEEEQMDGGVKDDDRSMVSFDLSSRGSMEYAVGGMSPSLSDLRSRGSVYDDLAVPVAQWHATTGECVSANRFMLQLTGMPDASGVDLPRLVSVRAVGPLLARLAALPSGEPHTAALPLRLGGILSVRLSRSATTGLVIGVATPPAAPEILVDNDVMMDVVKNEQ